MLISWLIKDLRQVLTLASLKTNAKINIYKWEKVSWELVTFIFERLPYTCPIFSNNAVLDDCSLSWHKFWKSVMGVVGAKDASGTCRQHG